MLPEMFQSIEKYEKLYRSFIKLSQILILKSDHNTKNG